MAREGNEVRKVYLTNVHLRGGLSLWALLGQCSATHHLKGPIPTIQASLERVQTTNFPMNCFSSSLGEKAVRTSLTLPKYAQASRTKEGNLMR